MAKKQNERRQARKERAKEAKEKREAEAEAQASVAGRCSFAWRMGGVLTLAIAGVCYWALDNRQLMGITLLIGGVLFLLSLCDLGVRRAAA